MKEGVALLERTPGVLQAMLSGLPEEWLEAREGEGAWNAGEVLGHLIHGEKTDWMPRVRHLLEHGSAVAFVPFDMEAHLREPVRPVAEKLAEFAALRAQGLAELAALGLTKADLSRPGRDPALGAVTLGQLLATWVTHDQSHLVQIHRTWARRWREAAGPWAAYQRVMREG